MVIDNKKENTKINALIKEILNSTKPKAILTSTQKLIKLIQPLQLNIEIDTTSLFNKINELPDKYIYIELGHHLYQKIPHLIEPDILKILLDYSLMYSFEDSKSKFNILKTLTKGFKVISQYHIYNLIEVLYFDFLLDDKIFSQEILVSLFSLMCNGNLPQGIIDLIIDTCIIKAFNFRNNKNKIYDLLPLIFQMIELYINQLLFKRSNVLKNIIALFSYYTSVIHPVKGSNNTIDPWAYMCICYQKDCNKAFRLLLNNIIYYPNISYTFTDVRVFDLLDNDYKGIDLAMKEKKVKRELKYRSFIQKQQDAFTVLEKEKITICKGAILLIGWSLWGYKKVSTINASNSVILSQLLKLVKEATGVSFEVIRCLQRLVRKYGMKLIDEWHYIFEIINYITEKEIEWSTDSEKTSILKDIIHHINLLLLDYHYYGDIFKANQFIKKMKPSNRVMDIIIKTRSLLLSTEDFYSNYQSIIIENFINSKSNQIKTFIMEMIRYLYSFSFNQNFIKAKIIEDNLVKYYNEIIKSFEDDETNLAFFSYLLTSISTSTTEIVILEKLFKSILSHHPEQDKKERKKNYEKFQYTTLKEIYDNINNNFQIDKAKKFNTFFFKSNTLANEKIMRFDMWIITKLLVNENNEIFLSNTNKLQLLLLNFRYSTCQLETKVSDSNSIINNKLVKSQIYQPYVVLKHNKLFSYLILQLKKDETNSAVCEDILVFFLRTLRKIFFFQGVPLVDIIKEIIDTDDISKYSSRKKMVILLEEILINICYHLSFNLINDQAYDSDINSNTSILNIKEENLKAKSLLCLLNSFESFSIMFSEIIKRFKTFIQFEKYQLNSIKNKFLLDVTAYEQNNLPREASNETQLTFLIVLSYLMKTTTSLHFYFVSIIPHVFYSKELYVDRVNFNSPESRYDIKNNINALETKQCFNREFTDLIIKRFLNDLMANIWLCEHVQNYPIAVLHCLIGMKELLWQFGDSVVIKVIYIALILGYTEDQNDIESAFETHLGFRYQKNKKQDDMLLVHDKAYKDIFLLKQDFIRQLADIAIIYYLRKVKISHPMWMIINRIFSKKKTMKDMIMFDYCNWALTIKGDRDELSLRDRGIVYTDSQIYFGNYNIIVATPIYNNNNSYNVVIRNCISNTSIIINPQYENDYQIKNSFEALLKEINKEQGYLPEAVNNTNNQTKTNNSKDDTYIAQRNNKIQFKKHRSKSQNYTYNSSYFNSKKVKANIIDANNIIRTLINLSTLPYNEFKQIAYDDYISDQISLLDTIPVYKTYYCSIIFFPNLSHITQYDVMSYTSNVTERYLSFINALGNLYNIIDNPHLAFGGMNSDGSDGNYVICYKDSLFHLVFHISNLLLPSCSIDPAEIIAIRKRVLSQDYINIIWMDNPLMDCNENYFFTQYIKVFVIIHPLSSTHYQISRRYNDKAKEIELHKAIEPYLNNDYVINFQCQCSVEYFIQSLLTMQRIIDYLLNESNEREVCLIDNMVKRMNVIKKIKLGLNSNQSFPK